MRGVGAERVRGVVVVGEVVDEQVEAVARDEPAADRRGVGVDRAERAVAQRDRRAGPVGLVERCRRRTASARSTAGRPGSAAGGGGGRGRVVMLIAAVVRPGVLERLVDRLGAPRADAARSG